MAPRHPLQRLASPGRTLSLLLHVLGIYSFLTTFQWVHNFPQLGPDAFGGNY